MSRTDGGDTLPGAPQCTTLQVTFPSDVQETVVTVHGVRVEKRYLANWEKWSRVPVVTLLQAVHLSFGVEPSTTFFGCTPTAPLAERMDLALANIGPGGPLEIVADLYAPISSWLGLQGHTVRVRLTTFGDWVLSNDLQLDLDCPQSARGL